MLAPLDVKDFNAWSASPDGVVSAFKSEQNGISEHEAHQRLNSFGYNELAPPKKRNLAFEFLSNFLNPLSMVLLIVGVTTFFLSSQVSAGIIFLIVLVSACLTFYQEYSARDSAEKLRRMIHNTATVVRQGVTTELPMRYLVPGDMVRLSAGDMVPADCRVISCKDFFINQAVLTGESLPVEKNAEAVPAAAKSASLPNAVFLGSSVVSGAAEVIVVNTGANTQFGELSRKLSQTAVETAFDRGVRDYTMLMIRFVVVLVLVIFAINAVLKNDALNALLFALAVAVGLTPEMLPVIVTANLSQGARNMAKKEAIVKKLPSIQNLGAMDVLCTDKTGTLTEDKIALVRHLNIEGNDDHGVLSLAYLNSHHQTGLSNPMDLAVIAKGAGVIEREVAQYRKIDEIPFDFLRRRMSVVVQKDGEPELLLVKGAPETMVALCTSVRKKDSRESPFSKEDAATVRKLYDSLSADGYRVLLLASRRISVKKKAYAPSDEKDLTFEGLLAFLDPAKHTARDSIQHLVRRGIEVKILSGDNELVNFRIAREVGLEIKGMITGDEVANASDDSLLVLVEKNTIFARVTPVQKERIILALQRNKHVVGYLGDGINDALALKTSDVGISVDSAVDVAKEAADIILLRKSLHVIYEGVDEGRRTFCNTTKYLKMGSSSNFGNMFSVVGASVFLPFLPMAPIQIILNNFLYDMSQLGIPTDEVDADSLSKPVQWNLDGIRNFLIFMGPVSSIFDYITFGVLFLYFQAPAAVFQTGWFIESLLTQTLIIHVIRTNKVPFVESRASWQLILLSIAIVTAGFLIILTPIGAYFGFAALPAAYFPILAAIVLGYLVLGQVVKTALLRLKIIS